MDTHAFRDADDAAQTRPPLPLTEDEIKRIRLTANGLQRGGADFSPDMLGPGRKVSARDLCYAFVEYLPLQKDVAHRSPPSGSSTGASDDDTRDQSEKVTLTQEIAREIMSSDLYEDHSAFKQIFFIALRAYMKAPRPLLSTVDTVDGVVELLASKCKRILVITGAGISVAAGIPDFRSPRSGFYAKLAEYGLESPSDVFFLDKFKKNPALFYSLAREIYRPTGDKVPLPTRCHQFIAYLERTGRLLRNYTQNIDGLERAAGITRVIQCHGSFESARCQLCCATVKVSGSDVESAILERRVPLCTKCNGGLPHAIMKPEIVFFGEQLPNEFFDHVKQDLEDADLVLVIGSSLSVAPVKDLARRVRDGVPCVLINFEATNMKSIFDVILLGEADEVVTDLAKRAGWDIGFSNDDEQKSKDALSSEPRCMAPRIYAYPGAKTRKDQVNLGCGEKRYHDEDDSEGNSTCEENDYGETDSEATESDETQRNSSSSEPIAEYEQENQNSTQSESKQ